jgi:glycolate oxidase FAD binding subunit
MAPLPPFEPADAQTAASMLAIAAADGISLVPTGNGTKMLARLQGDGEAIISTAKLTTGLVHYSGDLVATAPAGMTLRDVNAALARERQWIPLDPPYADRATIGGIVACNASGPRRHRFGAPRDLIIGVEVALANGRVVRSGGRVVKNVAGYDLGRLLCGSRGSLGLITSVNFKLAPLTAASRTLVARFPTADAAARAAADLATSPALTPSTIELIAPQPRLLVRFETTAHAADRMADTATALLTTLSHDVARLDSEAEAAVWAEHQQLESASQGLVATISVLPTAVATAVDTVASLAAHRGLAWCVTGRAALGVLRVRCEGSAEAQQAFALALRTALDAGHVQVERIDNHAGLAIDLLAPVGTAASVGFAVKRRFDPSGVLPYPWRRS